MKPLVSALVLLSITAAAQQPGRYPGLDQQRRGRGPTPTPPAAPSIGGPRIGFVFDAQRKALRPVLGMPGAAHVGAPVEIGVPLRQAEVAPGRDLALAEADDGRLLLIRLSGDPVATELKAPPFPQLMAFSPRGASAAVLYAGRVEVWNLRTLAQRAVTVDLASVPEAIGALAVSDDGQVMLLAAESGVYSWDQTEGLRLAGNLARASAVAFAPGTHDGYAADPEQDRLYGLRAGQFGVLAGPAEGLAGPVAIHVRADGSLLVANSRNASLLRLAPGQAPESMPCECRANWLAAGTEPDVLLFGSQPLKLLDQRGASPRMWFVPDEVEDAQ